MESGTTARSSRVVSPYLTVQCGWSSMPRPVRIPAKRCSRAQAVTRSAHAIGKGSMTTPSSLSCASHASGAGAFGLRIAASIVASSACNLNSTAARWSS